MVRLLILALGTCAVMIDLCTSFNCRYYSYRSVCCEVERAQGRVLSFFRSIVLWGLTASFFVFLSLRVCFSSLVPAWSGALVNLIHFALGVLIILDQFARGK